MKKLSEENNSGEKSSEPVRKKTVQRKLEMKNSKEDSRQNCKENLSVKIIREKNVQRKLRGKNYHEKLSGENPKETEFERK